MKKYNRYKRATRKINTRKHAHTSETCDTRDAQDRRTRIHIPITYDNYNKIEYVPIIYGKTRNTRAHTYVSVTNAINEIFPEINAPHTQHTHRAIAPYHKYIPQETNYTRPEPEPDTIMKDTRRVKCIIYSNGEIIHIGTFRRTRVINISRGTREFTLHRGKRSIQVYEQLLYPDEKIHGITVKEIKAHDVEIYRI